MMEEENPEPNVGASNPEPYSLPEDREMPVSNFSRREEIMSAKKELEELSSMEENPWKFMEDVNPTEGKRIFFLLTCMSSFTTKTKK